MTYNDNLILRYLYGLDEKRDYPQSIKRFLIDVGSDINEDRESAINELYGLKITVRNSLFSPKIC